MGPILLLIGVLLPPGAPLPAGPEFAPLRQEAGDPARRCEAAVQAAEWEAAVAHCEAALREDPESFGIHYYLGFAHEARESWAEAGAAFEAFVTSAEAAADGGSRVPEQVARAVRSAGIAYLRAGDTGSGLPLLDRAVEAAPTDAEASFWLGVGRLRTGDPGGAETAFLTVRREAPEIAPALFFLGRIRYDAGDYEAARTRLEEYLAADPGGPFRADAHWMAGSTSLRASGARGGDEQSRARAARHFAALVEVEPDSRRAAVAHYFLGAATAERGECESARRHYERFLEIAPDDERAPEVARYLEEGLTECGASPDHPGRARTGAGMLVSAARQR